MRKLAIMTVSAFALAATPALAQMSAPGGPGQPAAPHVPSIGGSGPATGPTAQPQMPAVNPLTTPDVSLLNGTDVYGANGNKIGSVSTALMNPTSKKIDRLVVSAGGVLGIGAHRVALPVDQFTWDAGKLGFLIAQTEQQLKSMPAWHNANQAEANTGASSADVSH